MMSITTMKMMIIKTINKNRNNFKSAKKKKKRTRKREKLLFLKPLESKFGLKFLEKVLNTNVT